MSLDEKTIFFAYQGKSKGKQDDNVDSIQRAIKEYNQYQKTYIAESWENHRDTAAISKEVLGLISDCEVFVCDLTHFNHNVLFELGYAIGKNKKILILLNTDFIGASKKYQEFFLKDIRYTSLKSSLDITQALQQKNFKNDLLNSFINLENFDQGSLDLLYIKSKLKNQPTLDLGEKIEQLKEAEGLSLQVDDPLEVSYRPVDWYFKNIYKSKCVIIHIWGEDVNNAFLENAQNSFFAGLASGLDKKVLLVAPSKYKAPLDYYDILIQYESSDDLVRQVENWLSKELIYKKIEEEIEVIEEHQSNLMKLGIGCEIAEYEKDKLLNYFVETSPYLSALKDEKAIIVGRKGSGKSAIYIKLLDELSKDKFNYIVNLKPESEELLENSSLSNIFTHPATKKTFFITAWRLTIFSKLTYSVYEKLINRSIYESNSAEETKLIDFVKENETFMKMNVFGVVFEICNKIKSAGGNINSTKILDALYHEYLTQNINIVKNYFKSIKAKYYKIIVIADNLDKAWDSQGDLDIQSEIIISLLEIDNKIKQELVNKENSQIDFKTIIFLRKDIFEYILKLVKEPDKLTLIRNEINWEGYPELLKKVVENRFRFSLELPENTTLEKTWKEFFGIKGGKHPFDAIKSIVTLRPRDVIYFVSQLFDSAINRGGDKVVDSDFATAIKNYTNFLNENLIAETKAEYPEITEILAKLQEYHGKKLEYKVYSKILDFFKFSSHKKEEFTKALFEKSYMLGFDNATNQPFSDVETLQKKLKEKKWGFLPKKVYVIAHAKYYAIKNLGDKAF